MGFPGGLTARLWHSHWPGFASQSGNKNKNKQQKKNIKIKINYYNTKPSIYKSFYYLQRDNRECDIYETYTEVMCASLCIHICAYLSGC